MVSYDDSFEGRFYQKHTLRLWLFHLRGFHFQSLSLLSSRVVMCVCFGPKSALFSRPRRFDPAISPARAL